MSLTKALSKTQLLVVLSLAYAVNAQYTYRRRTPRPARIIAGCVVAGAALFFFLLAFWAIRRRRRMAQTFIATLPRPHAGEQAYAGPQQQYAPPMGSPPVIHSDRPYMPQYPSQQSPYPAGLHQYPSQQQPFGEKPQDESLPPYSKETNYTNAPQAVGQPNASVQPPPPVHTSGQDDGGGFLGGFRPRN